MKLMTTVSGKTYVWSRATRLWVTTGGETLTNAEMASLRYRA